MTRSKASSAPTQLSRRRQSVLRLLWASALFTGAFSAPTPGHAQSKKATNPTRLSMSQAVSTTLRRHPSLRAADQATAGARSRASQARTAWIPRIKLEASYALMGPIQKLTIDTGLTLPGEDDPIRLTRELGSLHNAAAGVSVAWRAFDFGARGVRIAAAKALVDASKASKEDRRAKVAYAARAAYLAALFFEEVERITKRSLKVAQRELNDNAVKSKAGLGNDLDVARSRMRVAEISARLVEARQGRHRALTNLRLLMGLKKGDELKLTDNLKALGSRKPANLKDSKGHPLRKRLHALEQAARLEHKRLGRSFWPTLDLVGSFKYQYPKNYFETDTGGIAYMAGVRLTWNVFDGDLWRRRRREAELKVREIQAQDDTAREEIARRDADAHAKIRTARAAVRTAQKTLEAAKVYLKAAKASKKAGTGTALEVKKAADSVDKARLALLKAYFDGATAWAGHKLAQGQAAQETNP